MADQFVTRFAPSPTGQLHLGHAYSALLASDRANEAGGRFILRIEDIDKVRCRPEFEKGIIEDLTWLGLRWERDVRRQSEHFDEYRMALDKLDDLGLLYRCTCTRREIREEVAWSPSAPHGPEGPLYPGTCRKRRDDRLPPMDKDSSPYAIRLDVMQAISLLEQRGGWPLFWQDEVAGTVRADPASLGDVVLARKDTPTSYHLAVTVDDARQGVTHIIRGEDLLHTTHVHRLLQQLLELPAPVYLHHRLLTDETGRRYAKRDKANTLKALREAGRDPNEIIRELSAMFP